MQLIEYDFKKPQDFFFCDRLINAMHCIFRAPMSIVLAPLGYGGKTAVSQYLLSTDASIMWLTLPENADKCYLWKSLHSIITETETMERWDSMDTFEKIDLIVATANEKAKKNSGKKNVLVIDKLQNVSDPDGHVRYFLKYVADIFIPDFHIVLISSSNAHLDSSFFMSNSINIVGKRLLRLEKGGISLFFNSYGIELSTDELDTALEISEGWLDALSTMVNIVMERGQFDASTLKELKQRMAEYIRKGLYNSLPSDVKRFITGVFPAGDFSREQARFICANSDLGVDSEKCIDYLLDNNILIDYNYDKNLFHIHNLLNIIAGEEFSSLQKCCCDKVKNALAAWQAANKSTVSPYSPKTDGEPVIEVSWDISILTTREREIFNCIRQGLAYKEIAFELCISENTVKTTLKKIYKKMGIHSRRELESKMNSREIL